MCVIMIGVVVIRVVVIEVIAVVIVAIFKEGTACLLRGTGLFGAHATQPRGRDEFFGGFGPCLFD